MMLEVDPRRREVPYGGTKVSLWNDKSRPLSKIFTALPQGMDYQMRG